MRRKVEVQTSWVFTVGIPSTTFDRSLKTSKIKREACSSPTAFSSSLVVRQIREL
jgi:hypothetical protein